MFIKEYNYLPIDAKIIRTEVFVKEQGFIEEFDKIDETATHLVLYENDIPTATCRIYYNNNLDSYVVGRIAVIKTWRNNNFGAAILEAAEVIISKSKANRVMLSSQLQAMGFYEKQGYVIAGDPFLDEGCPHVWMKKEL